MGGWVGDGIQKVRLEERRVLFDLRFIFSLYEELYKASTRNTMKS